MLNVLIDNFETEFLPSNSPDRKVIASCLEAEWARIMDPAYLEDMVISKPLMEWDFRALEDGFSDLVQPFTQCLSRIPVLYLHALRDLDCHEEKFKQAMVILEYAFYTTGINDYFNFQRVFTEEKRDLKAYARLTQIKYAGQFLSTYPNYMLVKNVFDADVETINALHRLLANIIATTGISRGVLVKWSHRQFNDITTDMYCQNAINMLSNFIHFPIIMAAIFAKLPEAEMARLKQALSHFSLFLKLNAEYKNGMGQLKMDVSSHYQDTFRALTFPGFPFINSRTPLEHKLEAGQKYPHFQDMYDQVLNMLKNHPHDGAMDATRDLAGRSFDAFLDIMSETGLLPNMTAAWRKCFSL